MGNPSFICLVTYRFKILLLVSAALVTGVVPQQQALAQYSSQASSENLQDALRRIALDSNDSSALADAGLAALEMGDLRAAIGFLAKADQIYGSSGRVKAGLGRALLAEENPFGALRYFDEAVANGIAPREIAADRGLAYDLIGRNRDAQKDYELAIRYGSTDQLVQRYAVSLGISGDVDRAEAQLNPLLMKSDREAWRNRAFIYAMNGRKKDADDIVEQTMERRMAKAIKPFFERMPKLTAAQKAAAVHFGHFPASENIGVDVAAVQLASNMAGRGGEGADAGLVPVGEALGAKSDRPRVLAMPDKSPRRRPGVADRESTERKSARREKKNQVEQSAETQVATSAGAKSGRVTSFASAEPSRTVPPPSEAVAAKSLPDPIKTTEIKPASKSPAPGFATTLGVGQPPVLVSQSVERKVEIAGRQPASRKPLASQALTPSTAKPLSESPSGARTVTGAPVNLVTFDLAQSRSASTGTASVDMAASRPLADIISGIAIPEQETRSAVVPVDLDEIEPAKPQPKIVAKPVEKAPVKPKAPAHPKRYWVQIATGANLNALKFDWRRMTKKQPDLFKSQKAWTSPWGATRRMVVGPFDDFKAAKAFEAELRKGGGDGFAWASADGVEVNELTK